MTATNQVDAISALSLGSSALESGNYAEAHMYFGRVLETEPNNAQALKGKGLAAGWQSNLRQSRLAEMLKMYQCVKAVVPADSALPVEMASEMLEMLMAYERLSREHTMEFITVDHARYEAFDRAEEIVELLDILRKDHVDLAQQFINPLMIQILRAQIGTSGCMGQQLDRFKRLLASIPIDVPQEEEKTEDADKNGILNLGVSIVWVVGALVLYWFLQPHSFGGWVWFLAAATFGVPLALIGSLLGLLSVVRRSREAATKSAQGKSPGQV